jgi:hypothetical protein
MFRVPDDHIGWRLLLGVLVFMAALAVVSLLSIDDYESERPRGVTEVQHGSQGE